MSFQNLYEDISTRQKLKMKLENPSINSNSIKDKHFTYLFSFFAQTFGLPQLFTHLITIS